jgi:L-amino acid N-acyltransferase YncA
MQRDDWEAVRNIYQEGIAGGNATFETKVPRWQKWNIHHLPACRLVARSQGRVIGWAALSPVSDRYVYRGVCEVSIYVAASFRGRGVGKALLEQLVREAEEAGIWTLQAGIFPENVASIALHESCGFRQVGNRERIGQTQDRWRDVIFLERRSQVVGA